jgi:hypothetical protein
VLLAQWLLGRREDVAGVRLDQVAAWLAGFAVYQWLSPVGPSWWTSIVEHTHPGVGAIGGSLPSFLVSFGLSAALTLPGLAAARRHRTSCA